MKKILVSAILATLLLPFLAYANPPVAEIRSLLNARLTAQGNLMFSEFRLFFPPAEPVSGRVDVLHNGKVINTREISDRYRGLGDDNVMANVGIRGVPVVQLSQDGEYEINIVINDELITRVPFSLGKTKSDDPFAPSDGYSFVGPWQKLAYLQGEDHRDKMSGETGQGVSIAFWPGQADATDDKSFYVHAYLKQGGKTVAHSQLNKGKQIKKHKNSPMFDGTVLKFYFPHEKSKAGNAKRLTFSDLKDGDYEVTIVHEGTKKDIRQFSMSVKGGEVVPHARADLGYSPIEDRLVPRAFKTGSTTDEHQPIYWLVAD